MCKYPLWLLHCTIDTEMLGLLVKHFYWPGFKEWQLKSSKQCFRESVSSNWFREEVNWFDSTISLMVD